MRGVIHDVDVRTGPTGSRVKLRRHADQVATPVTEPTSLELVAEQDLAGQMTALVLDLTRLLFIDSAGIETLMRIGAELRARGQLVCIALPQTSPVRRALEISGGVDHLAILDNVSQARVLAQPHVPQR